MRVASRLTGSDSDACTDWRCCIDMRVQYWRFCSPTQPVFEHVALLARVQVFSLLE